MLLTGSEKGGPGFPFHITCSFSGSAALCSNSVRAGNYFLFSFAFVVQRQKTLDELSEILDCLKSSPFPLQRTPWRLAMLFPILA